ncbi:MAG TPA: PA14 domain-containing protein, partial [Candidatus Poseidoniales archaeon]|nr:PA14 domain-containing protein [Candidatus Poseidoniales archaeon]
MGSHGGGTPGPVRKIAYDVHLYILPPENLSTALTTVGAPAISEHEAHLPDAISTVESLLIGGDIPEDGMLRMPHLITPAGDYFNIDSNDDATCVISTDSEIVCWGQPPATIGETLTTTGAGSHLRYPLPSTLEIPDDFAPIRVSLGSGGDLGGGCAVSSDGRVACWGLPSYDLSSSVFETVSTLVELDDSSPVVDIAVSSSVTCALHQFGNMSCWGPAVDQVAVRTDVARLGEQYEIRSVIPPEGASVLDSMPAVMSNSMTGDEWSVVWRTIDRLIAGENGICADMNDDEHDDGQFWCIGYDDSGFESNPNDVGVITNLGSGAPIDRELAPPQFLTGLNYREYSGYWNSLPDFSQLTVSKSGIASVPDLTSASQTSGFALVFTGFIEIPVSGSWTFHTVSDDGSALYINHNLVVNNDGLHGNTRRSGTVTLSEGMHAFKVTMFQKYGGRSLSVEWNVPDGPRQVIPASAYKSTVAGDPLPAPAALAGDNLCHYATDDGRMRCVSMSGEDSDIETTMTITDAPDSGSPIVSIDGTDEIVCLLFHPRFTSDDLDKQVGCYGSNQHGAMDSNAPSIFGSSLNLSHLHYPDWGSVSPPTANFEAIDLSVSQHGVCLTSTMGEVFCWGDTDHGATGRGIDVANHLVEKVSLPGERKSSTAYAAFSPATWMGDADSDGYTDSMEVACDSRTDSSSYSPKDTDGATFLVWLDQGSPSQAFFCDWLDRDADNDGFMNSTEILCLTDPLDPADTPVDSDEDGLCDGLDNDRDLDGFTTEYEEFCGSSDDDPLSTPPDIDGDQLCDPEDDDDDGDGASDAFEIQCSSDPQNNLDVPNDLDADLICDQFDNDKDGDGYLNGTEVRCGSSDMDALSVPDDMDGDTICDSDDDDKDGDGFAKEYEEHCGSSDDDINSVPPDVDGDNVCDLDDDDADGDGFPAATEALCGSSDDDPASVPPDLDQDGICDLTDPDADGDGFSKEAELRCGSRDDVLDSPIPDLDGDGTCDIDDSDMDGDGYDNVTETRCGSRDDILDSPIPDMDQDGTCDFDDDDADGDGYNRSIEAHCGSVDNALGTPIPDLDGDGICDIDDFDMDGDGYDNETEARCGSVDNEIDSPIPDLDGDGICDVDDSDADGDGYSKDLEEHCGSVDNELNSPIPDLDQDGICDIDDDDADGDGYNRSLEEHCGSSDTSLGTPIPDIDGDGICDIDDPDADGDGFSKVEEEHCGSDDLDPASLPPDMDQDRICDVDDPDRDGDGFVNTTEDHC